MTQELTQVQTIRQNLQRMAPEFKPLLPANVSVEKFSRVVMTAVQNDRKLLDCDQGSLFSACLESAKDGLLPDGKEAALVAFGNKVTYMRMIRGLIEKIYETGLVLDVDCQTVWSGDKFTINLGTGRSIEHQPKIPRNDDAQIIGVYSVLYLKDGLVSPHFMPTEDIDRIKHQFGQNIDSGPWATSWEQMAYKTCLRQHCKTKALRGQFDKLFEDHDQYFDVPEVREVKTVSATSGVAAAKQAMGDN